MIFELAVELATGFTSAVVGTMAICMPADPKCATVIVQLPFWGIFHASDPVNFLWIVMVFFPRASKPDVDVKPLTVGNAHGDASELTEGTVLFPMYHPASLIYNPSNAPVYAEDMKKLADIVNIL